MMKDCNREDHFCSEYNGSNSSSNFLIFRFNYFFYSSNLISIENSLSC